MASRFIPEELLIGILTRLPVKYLCQFKCVSKPWLALISSESFVKTHVVYSNNLPRVILTYVHFNSGLKHCSLINNDEVEPIDMDYYPGKEDKKSVSIVGTCDGLVCLLIRPEQGHHDFFLWNPSTRISEKLPALKTVGGIWKTGFGYNAVGDDYEVFSFLVSPGELEISIYSFKANSWKTRVFINSCFTNNSQHVFFARKIHMAPYPPTLSDIISFDIESEVQGTIEQPSYGKGVKSLILKDVGGCFCVVCEKETQVELWVMKEYGVKESWTKLLNVSFLDYPIRSRYINPLGMLPSGEILVAFMACLEAYNPKDNSRRVLDHTSNCGPFVTANLYVESLVSPTQHERMGR